jgi:hypothetical protein
MKHECDLFTLPQKFHQFFAFLFAAVVEHLLLAITQGTPQLIALLNDVGLHKLGVRCHDLLAHIVRKDRVTGERHFDA